MRRTPIRLIAGLTLVICQIQSPALCQDSPSPESAGSSAATPAAEELARGFVFDDRNGNGKRDSGEAGIKGIRVSSGSKIVTTDANGQYEIPVADDTIIFVIKPPGLGDTFEPEPVAAVFLYTQTRGLTGKLPFQSATDRPPPQIC